MQDESLAHLSELTHLTSLYLAESNVTGAGLVYLSKLSELMILDLSQSKSGINTGLSHLSSLTKLRFLDLGGDQNGFTDNELAHLANLKSLVSLSLSMSIDITDMGLGHIANLTNLTFLNLDGLDNITDAGLAKLFRLTQLKELSLCECYEITDDAVAQLLPFTQLTDLSLVNCYITDDVFLHLKKFLHLKLLVISEIKSAFFTEEGIEEYLNSKLPNIEIQYC